MTMSRIERLISEGKSRKHITQERIDELEEDEDYLKEDINCVRAFLLANFFSCFLAMLTGLISLLYIPSILEVLIITGNSSTPDTAFARYLRTLNHTYAWFHSESSLSKSLIQVRNAHIRADKSSSSKRKGQFMSQYDMVVTQWAFVGLLYTKPSNFGLKSPSKSGLEALRRLMYKVGYFLGVEDKFNLCYGSVEMTQSYSKDISEYIIKPAIEDPQSSVKSDEMTKILLKGIHIINPFVLPLAFGKCCFRALECNKKASKIRIPFFSLSNILFWIQIFVTDFLMLSNLTRHFLVPCLNYLLRFNIYLSNLLNPSINKMKARLYAK
ncbi:uncharacterized protein [Lepeophtheirus salmonis]|uniref:uncharacterized protein n=1 Tax=Lepeophtheirus salmonis TaxID=72036 RepID=UPI001AE5E9E5|nr:uncharacterized protein LOC121121462 isoform X1 [Lepeophtheirus salmonis]